MEEMKGIYILSHEKQVLYVGRTRSMKTRLQRHKDIPYNHVIKIPISLSTDRKHVERKLINLLQPEYNKR